MTNEPQSSQANDISMADSVDSADTADTADTALAERAPDALQRFRQGIDMQALYARMRPDQRTAIAGEFIRLLTLAGDDHVEQFRLHFQRRTQFTPPEAEKTEELLSADQVAAIDAYVRQKHPEMIAQMMEHPVTQSSLETPGAAPEAEQDIPANVDKVMPTENVATSGAAYATSWEMMELGGERANKLAEDPHELGAGPGGELEREQRDFENEGEEAERPTESSEHDS